MLEIAQKHVFDLFKESKDNPLVYHNYNHTLEVVSAANEIAKKSNVSDIEVEIVMLAAWFHDTGYLEKSKGHEEISVKYATQFLEQHDYPQEKINAVASTIMATQFPQKPQNLLESIICDADLAHFGKKGYMTKCKLLGLERKLMAGPDEDYVWPDTDIKVLSEHTYHTEYAQTVFNDRKSKNILKLKEQQIEKEKKESKKKGRPERGIETMFRVTFKNHMALSAMADNKANIMLSINAIIISISLSTLFPNLDSQPDLIIPAIILLFVCISTIIFATLSTRPKISEGKFTRQDVKQRKPNLLFFGNFHGMPSEEFEWGMNEMMNDRDYLYGSMTKDVYSLGKVLAKKYKYLRIAYNIFMFGMVISVLAFMIMFILTAK